MDHYVVAGHPVEHSQSPFIHAEFARQTGHAIHYGRALWPLDGFAPALRELVASGVKGCNVTVPFKFDAWRAAALRTPRAELAQAANVLRFDAAGWLADNTDGVGLVDDIEGNAGVALAGLRVLLIGAGGAAAGVLGPLRAAGAREIVVANRTVATAQALVERHARAPGDGVLRACGLADAQFHTGSGSGSGVGFDVVINASSSSLHGAPVPVSHAVLRPGALALDMMYGAAAAPFMDWARSHGATARDGLGMLVEQAAHSFALWRGVHPDTAPVLAALRQRLSEAARR